MKIILPFTSPELPPLDQAGGKALSLMQMTAAGIARPARVCADRPVF